MSPYGGQFLQITFYAILLSFFSESRSSLAGTTFVSRFIAVYDALY